MMAFQPSRIHVFILLVCSINPHSGKDMEFFFYGRTDLKIHAIALVMFFFPFLNFFSLNLFMNKYINRSTKVRIMYHWVYCFEHSHFMGRGLW